jgi:5-methylcytosine-specific restriction endonuclease McrA
MKINHTKCLLLNPDYSPVCLISWKRAVIWYFKYRDNNKYGIDIIDFYKNDCIHGVNQTFPLPAVAKTKRYFRFGSDTIIFSRKNIFIRDNYTCQYCGKKFEYNKLTYDHVIPKSSSGPTTWSNIVTACVSCNSTKGNRTPKQANMPLLKNPIKPEKRLRYLPIFDYLATINEIPEEWKLYLPEY